MPLHNAPGHTQHFTPPCEEHEPERLCEREMRDARHDRSTAGLHSPKGSDTDSQTDADRGRVAPDSGVECPRRAHGGSKRAYSGEQVPESHDSAALIIGDRQDCRQSLFNRDASRRHASLLKFDIKRYEDG